MSPLREIAAHIRTRQRRASDPDVSVWVAANAGSGKTHVLAQRVLRHLLAGVPPAKILCLTFTKAAAANMASRVFAALARWTELDDTALAAAIAEIGATQRSAAELTFARRLFAHAVETPGGLKIQTIHAFCERLLHLFPFEANVPGRFDVLDDVAQAELLDRARRDILSEAQHDAGDLGRAYARLAEDISQAEFESLIRDALRHRAVFAESDPSKTAEQLRRALGLGAQESVASIECEMIDGGIAPRHWRDFGAWLTGSTKTSDRDLGAAFLRAADLYGTAAKAASLSVPARAECLAAYLEIFFTKSNGRPPRARLATQELARARPDLLDALKDEQARLADLRERCKAAETFARSHALSVLMQRFFARYHHLKALRGFLDFDDLIHRTAALLQRSDARWVLYKLDSGIDHILVDEAQDTSEAQWKILEDLTGEFAAGAGGRPTRRTFFAVGDEKQSIFSFQGAAPQMFHAMRRHFARAFSQGGSGFEYVQLTDSFRSVPAILSMVDTVFGHAANQRGLVTDDQWMGHSAARKGGLPGLVEIWPPLATSAAEAPEDWRLPLDVKGAADPANILAERVAAKIEALLAPGSGDCVADADGRARPVRPSDILILVRTRNAFFDAIIRALKGRHVPVAGADRLELTQHIAIMDLMAAGRIARLPEDDLSLACVLKSPLIGFDDADLLRLAPRRPGALISALEASDAERDRTAAAKVRLWQSRAALPPFAFYARLLGEDGGRRAMEARLGAEACDALDEFLRLALDAERDGILTLAAFLATFEGIKFEIKRDMETLGDSVRVMTVHAAKGLEAKIVFLPDTCSAPNGQLLPKLFAIEDRPGATKVIVWAPRKDGDPPAVAEARAAALAAAEDEYRRLLYVALTRAEERLYIAGFHGAKEPPDHCWMRMIEAAVGDDFAEVPSFWNDGDKILRRASTERLDMGAAVETAPRAAPPSPAWLDRRAPAESRPQPPLRPSSALSAAEPEGALSRAALPQGALERGRLMHVLLQYLPQLPPEGRRQAAGRFLDVRATDLGDDGRARLIDEALAIFDLPDTGALFGPGSRAEVAVTGKLRRRDGTEIPIAGQVDRIAETDSQVLIADFKTGKAYGAAEVPAAFLTQMALYRAVLAPLWPGKRVTALLIFTGEAKLLELGEERLAAALAHLDLDIAPAG